MRVTFVIFIRHLCFCLLLQGWRVLFLLEFMFGFGFVIFQNLSSITQITFFIPPVHQIERVISSNGLCQCNMNIKLYYKYNAMHINRCFYLFLFSCSILLVSFCDCFKLFRHIFHFSAIQFICTLNGNWQHRIIMGKKHTHRHDEDNNGEAKNKKSQL